MQCHVAMFNVYSSIGVSSLSLLSLPQIRTSILLAVGLGSSTLNHGGDLVIQQVYTFITALTTS